MMLATPSTTKTFRIERSSLQFGRWIISLGVLALILSFMGIPFSLGDSGSHDPSAFVGYWFGIVALLVGYSLFLYGRNSRVELSNQGLKIYGWHNRAVLDCGWVEITAYKRQPCPAWWTNYPRPKWQIVTSSFSAWVPYLEEYPSFQREMIRHVPRSAIPSRYLDGSFKSAGNVQLPIKQFSLRVTDEGLSVDSAVSRVTIHWADVIFVEEIDFRVNDEIGDPRVPRIHIISDSGDFELTRFWDRYEDIRDLAFGSAPGSAVLVR